MLVLNKCSPVCSQSTLLEIREHVEEVYRCDEFDDRVAKELEPLIVFHLQSFKVVKQKI